MASLSSTGLGSGLDIEGLVTKLMAIERQPLTALAKKEAAFQAKITAYGTLKSGLSTFQTAFSSLTTASTFNTLKGTVADTSVASVTADSSAVAGSYSLEVTTLAVAQKLKTSGTYTDKTSTFGSGTLTIDFGTYGVGSFTPNSDKSSKTITINSSQNTLTGVRDAINAAGAGVTASIVNDGSGYRLMITSNDTGLENELRIQTTGSLSALAYDESGVLTSNMTQSQTAIDAALTFDGLSITSASNTLTDTLSGVTINLLKTNSGSPTTLTVSRDTSNVTSLIKNFVTAYNTLKSSLNTLTGYNAETKAAGTLQGDATALSVLSQLRSVFNTPLQNSGSGFTSLSDVGISFKKDGTLTLDTTKLSTALADTTKNVAGLFSTLGTPSDSLINFTSAFSTTKSGTYAVELTRIARQSVLTGNVNLSGSTLITAGSNDTLNLSVDGASISVTLTAGTYTDAQLAAELQTRVNGALTAGKVEVTTGASRSLQSSVDISAFTYPYAPASGNDSFQITVGATTETISLSGGSYDTAAELAAAIEDAITSEFGSEVAEVSVEDGQYLRIVARGASALSVAVDGSSTLVTDLFGTPTTTSGNELFMRSVAYGSGSVVSISGGNAASTLFGTAGTGSTGYDVAGTIGGATAVGFGQSLTVSSGDPAGLKVQVTGGSTGSRGTIKFDHGVAVQLNTIINSINDTSGLIATRTAGITSSIDSLGDQSELLALRLAAIEKRYRAQFNALDASIASMTQTANYLEQQLSALSSKK